MSLQAPKEARCCVREPWRLVVGSRSPIKAAASLLAETAAKASTAVRRYVDSNGLEGHNAILTARSCWSVFS